MKPKSVDVLISGAGPTGLTMALELAIHDISFRIIEKAIEPSDKSRALVLHPRSLELLRRHDVANDLKERGTVGTGARIFVNKKKAAVFDFTDLGFDNTEYPQPLWISQADTEAILRSRLQQHGVDVDWGVTAEGFEQDAAGVTATLSKDGVTEQVRCTYVVGCDGAHSAVRHAAGLSFNGAPYPQAFILCDAHLKWDQFENEGRHLSMFTSGNEVMMLFPLTDGIVRLVASLPADGLSNNNRSDPVPTLEDFKEILGQMLPGVWELSEPIWLANFRLHHRGADNYRKGRLFVAGDAAHIHSPAGGQGMNTGIQDAINLGWKLARTVQIEKQGDSVDETWLDSYNVERHRIGQHLLKGTDRIFSYASSLSPFGIWWRDFFISWVLPWAMSYRTLRARIFRFMSELGIRYRHSPMVGTSSLYRGRLKGGDRAPDGQVKLPGGETKFVIGTFSGSKFHLLLFSGRGPRSLSHHDLESKGSRLADSLAEKIGNTPVVHIIYVSSQVDASGAVDLDGKLHNVYGFEEPGYVLVRPDAYIAYIGPLSQEAELQKWISECY